MTLREKLEVGADEEVWYARFQTWFDEKYAEADIYLIRYDSRMSQFYIYNNLKGIYEPMTDPQIQKIFFDWADATGFETSSSSTKHAIQRLQSLTEFVGEWDDPEYECILDGLIDITNNRLIPHTPDIMFRSQIPRHYIDPNPYAIALFLYVLKSGTADWENILKFLVAMVHRRFDDEKFLICYGRTGSGKSTTLRIPMLLFGSKNTSAVDFADMGSTFGFESCYDKRVNVCTEGVVRTINPKALANLKKLTGNDGPVPVKIKYKSEFDYVIRLHIFYGIQQLFEFDQRAASERDSVMRRVILAYYPKLVENPLPQIKEIFEDSEFLDSVYSYLLDTPYTPIWNGSQSEYIKKNNQKWADNSNPIARICKELYSYSESPLDTLAVTSVVMEVKDCLDEDGYKAPSDLTAQVTRALKMMRIERNLGRGTKARYQCIKRNDTEN